MPTAAMSWPAEAEGGSLASSLPDSRHSDPDPGRCRDPSQTAATSPRPGPRHKDPDTRTQLALFYSPAKQAQEALCAGVGLTLMTVDLLLLVSHVRLTAVPEMVVHVVLGMATVDFISGFIHWAADTWGSTDMPIFGKTLLGPFREHHVHPTAITDYHFTRITGDSIVIVTPMLLYLLQRLVSLPACEIAADVGWLSYLFSLTVLGTFTNLIHKWSHATRPLPWPVTLLQEWWVILPRRHHRVHHVAPHDTFYCITTGWLDAPLHTLRFWTRLETAVHWATGAVPRGDDTYWANRRA